MNSKPAGGLHWSFWAIGCIASIWNAMGCVNFFVQMNPEALAAYRKSERAIVEGRSLSATAGFAIAAFGPAVGSLLLLLRKILIWYFRWVEPKVWNR